MIYSNFFCRELAKYKRSPLSFIILIFPILAGMIVAMSLSKMYGDSHMENIWENLLIGNKIQSIWTMTSIALVSIITSLIVAIDKDNNTYKVIFTSTMSKKQYYVEKLLTVCLFLFIVIFLYNVSVVIIGKIIFIDDSIYYLYIVKLIIKEYILILPIGAIQLYLAIYMENIIESIAIGLCGAILGLGIISQLSKMALLIPYSYPYFILLKNNNNTNITSIIFLSLIYLIIFLILGINKLIKVDISEVE